MTRRAASGEWMRQAEAARLLKVPRSTLAWRINAGRYRTKEVHGLRLVSRADVEHDAEAAQAAA